MIEYQIQHIEIGDPQYPRLKTIQTMIKLRPILLCIFLSATISTFGQNEKQSIRLRDSINMTFRDTVFNIAFDSISHNLGNIVPANENNRLVKYFKYLGTEPIFISRAWTGDPHYICDYPNALLIPNEIYSFTVCFWHQGKQGKMTKMMGFDLSDGNRISLTFTGIYIPKAKDE